jgi:2-polyprenyl-3-methyl-5-hydroxy-6-metoxy-1,4-benzoquinol methylase
MKNKIKYNAKEALNKSLTVQSQVVSLTGQNKRVLEFGCNIGETSLVLERNGCEVTGIEINRAAAEIAKNICKEVIIGDIEKDEVWEKIEGKFDVIIFADILEHLRNPDKILKRTKKYLKEDGFLIISLPNIANWRIRLSLLFGRFEYKLTGILDETHLRFYTLKSAQELIQKNYKIVKILPAATRIPKILLFLFPTILATQWVFKCK